MGEIADMMLDGTLCQGCGVYIGADFPSYCDGCRAEEARERQPQPAPTKQIGCGKCSRRFDSKAARDQHYSDKHLKPTGEPQ